MQRYPAWGSPKPALQMSDAVAAILLTENDEFVLQLRDDIPNIWYPGCWGCFGGAVDSGESPEAALRRELSEELEIEIESAEHISTLEFDLRPAGLNKCFRAYYRVRLSQDQWSKAVLHEGQAVESFSYAAMNELTMSPYDAFALHLYWAKSQGVLK